jgi:hypothetical protein
MQLKDSHVCKSGNFCEVCRDIDSGIHTRIKLQQYYKLPSQEFECPFGKKFTKKGKPGTELKKLLKRVGITATGNCSCNARAKQMDLKGVEWCKANVETIVGWLQEEAEKRSLPFFEWLAVKIVQRAIKNAERTEI